MTIEEFIEAQLQADEQIARAAIAAAEVPAEAASWHVADRDVGAAAVQYGDDIVCYNEGLPKVAQAEHIARQDPARVLAEVPAKRHALGFALAAFLEEEKIEERPGRDPETNAYDKGRADTARFMLRVLAAPYAEHPDYQQEWKL